MGGLSQQQLVQAVLGTGAVVAGGITGGEVYRRRRAAVRKVRGMGHGGEERMVTTADGTNLHVEIDGSECAPLTVVFTHGWFMDLTTWRHQRAALAGSPARRVYYDHRGYGKSERGPKGVGSVRQLAEDIYQVIEAVAPSGPVVIVGHSMGSFTIQALAGIHPELFGTRIVASVLISTAAQGSTLIRAVVRNIPVAHRIVSPTAGVLEIAAILRPYLVRALGMGLYRPFSYLFVDRKSSTEAKREFLAVISAAHLDVMGEYLLALAAHEELASLPALGNARTLVITGGHDLIVIPALSEAAAAQIPGVEHVIIPGSGHIVPFERAEEVNRLLGDVIDNALAKVKAGKRAG